MTNQNDHGEWCTVVEAAARLGITTDAVRQRVKRGVLTGARSNDGKPRVWVTDQSVTMSDMTLPIDRYDATDQSVAKAAENPVLAPETSQNANMTKQTDQDDWLIGFMEKQVEHERAEHRAQIERLEKRHEAEIARLERAYKAATDALMERVAAILVASRPKRWWWPG